MTQNNDLDNKMLFDAIQKLQEKNSELIYDVVNSINKLKETESKLDSVRIIYESQWSYILKKNPIKFLSFAGIILVIIIAIFFDYLKHKEVNYDNGKVKASISESIKK